METKSIVLTSAVAAMVPVMQNAAIEEPMPACGIESLPAAAKSTELACHVKQPALNHAEREADAVLVPTYRPTVGITVTQTYPVPVGVTVTPL